MGWFLMAVVLLLAAALFAAARYSRGITPAYGLEQGQLRPCPPRPNCVCSEAGTPDAQQRIEPLRLQGRDPEEAWAALQRAVAAAGGEAVAVRADYLAATFRTPLLGFVDDLEARLDTDRGLIHLRSASRVGHSDLGANRARVERLVEVFMAGRRAAAR